MSTRMMLLALLLAYAGGGGATVPPLWINELHCTSKYFFSIIPTASAPVSPRFFSTDDDISYDNAEGFEIAGVAGLSLAGYSVMRYNQDGFMYDGNKDLSGLIPDEGAGFGAIWFSWGRLQNGPDDGLALVNSSSGVVVELISWEGTFRGAEGPATNQTSVDIGVHEAEDTPDGQSLQLVGAGNTRSNFTWQPPALASHGSLNVGQMLVAVTTVSLLAVDEGRPSNSMRTTRVYFDVLGSGFSNFSETQNSAKLLRRSDAHELDVPCSYVSSVQLICGLSGRELDGRWDGKLADITISPDRGATWIFPNSDYQVLLYNPGVTRVGFVFSGRIDDFGWSYAQNIARMYLESVLGFAAVTTTFDNDVPGIHCSLHDSCPKACVLAFPAEGQAKISKDDPRCSFRQWPDYLKTLAVIRAQASRSDLVFCGSFTHMYPCWEAALEFTNVSFVHFSGVVGLPLPNVANLFARFYQPSYLVGVLLGKMLASRSSTHNVGYVSSFRNSETSRLANAFTLGLKSACPDCRLLVAYVSSLDDSIREAWAAQRLHREFNVSAIAQDTGSISIQEYCRDNNLWGIGSYADMREKVGERTLSSPIAFWGPALVRYALRARTSTFVPESHWPGIEKGISDIAPMSNFVPVNIKMEVIAAKNRLIESNDVVFCPNLHGKVRKASGEIVIDERCLDDEELLSMNYLVEGTRDLGDWEMPISQPCPAGHWCEDGRQTPCRPGTFGTNNSGFAKSQAEACSLCPAHSYGTGEGKVGVEAGCRRCPLGRAAARGTPAVSNCYARCTSTGHYWDMVEDRCTPCDPGTSLSSLDAFDPKNCTKCTRGYVAPEYGSSRCSPCPAGNVANDDNTKCLPCPEGTIVTTGGSSCLPCRPGTFANPKQTECTPCPSGRWSSATSAASNATCSKCPPGTYSEFEGLQAQRQCRQCPPGKQARHLSPNAVSEAIAVGERRLLEKSNTKKAQPHLRRLSIKAAAKRLGHRLLSRSNALKFGSKIGRALFTGSLLPECNQREGGQGCDTICDDTWMDELWPVGNGIQERCSAGCDSNCPTPNPTTPAPTAPEVPSCDGNETIVLETGESVVLSDGDGNYTDNMDCNWVVTGTKGATGLALHFNSFDLEGSAKCEFDYLRLFDGTSDAAPVLATLCGGTVPASIYLTSLPLALFAKFHTDSSVWYGGFELTVTATNTSLAPSTPRTVATISTPATLFPMNTSNLTYDTVERPTAASPTTKPTTASPTLETCSNGVFDRGETDVDCGGKRCLPCSAGQGCVNNGDCSTYYTCAGGTCVTYVPTTAPTTAPTNNPTAQPTTALPTTTSPTFGHCLNGVLDQDKNETDIDCGGERCLPCEQGRHCINNEDCSTLTCSGDTLKCATPAPTVATRAPTPGPTTKAPTSAPTSLQESQHCVECAAGRYNSGGGVECAACKTGSWSAAAQSVCTFCAAGRFGDRAFAPVSDEHCDLCPAGTYSSAKGVDDVERCNACPPGRSSSVEGATSFETCFACSLARFASQSGQTACARCISGTSERGASHCNICDAGMELIGGACYPCVAGTTSKAGGPCRPCENGRYAHKNGSNACDRCPDFMTTRSDDTTVCIAQRGFALSGATLFPCPKYGARCSNESGARVVDLVLEPVNVVLVVDKNALCALKCVHTHARPGYWRSTYDSLDILKCKQKSDCVGGRSYGQTGQGVCSNGTTGPLCAVCKENFKRERQGRPCVSCTEIGIAGSLAPFFLYVFGGGALVALLLARPVNRRRLSRWLSEQDAQSVALVGMTDHDARSGRGRIVEKFKIAYAFAQVVSSTYEEFDHLDFPRAFSMLASVLSTTNLDLFNQITFGCVVDISFYGELAATCIAPLILAAAMLWYAQRRSQTDGEKRSTMQIFTRIYLILLFCVYSGVTRKIFSTFKCERFVTAGYADEAACTQDHLKWHNQSQSCYRSFLRSDLSISCDASKHESWRFFAGLMALVYPVGVPLLFAWLLLRRRTNGEKDKSIAFIRASYKDEFYWWEIMELGRKLLLTVVLVFFYEGTPSQILVVILVSFGFFALLRSYKPYLSKNDDFLAAFAQALLVLTSLASLCLQVDVKGEDSWNEEAFDFFLTALVASVLMLALLEALYATELPRALFIRCMRRRKKIAPVGGATGLAAPASDLTAYHSSSCSDALAETLSSLDKSNPEELRVALESAPASMDCSTCIFQISQCTLPNYKRVASQQP